MGKTRLTKEDAVHILHRIEPVYKQYADDEEDTNLSRYLLKPRRAVFDALYDVTKTISEEQLEQYESLSYNHHVGLDTDEFSRMSSKQEHVGVRNNMYLALEQVYQDATALAPESETRIHEAIEQSPLYQTGLIEYPIKGPKENTPRHLTTRGIVEEMEASSDTLKEIGDVLNGVPAPRR